MSGSGDPGLETNNQFLYKFVRLHSGGKGEKSGCSTFPSGLEQKYKQPSSLPSTLLYSSLPVKQSSVSSTRRYFTPVVGYFRHIALLTSHTKARAGNYSSCRQSSLLQFSSLLYTAVVYLPIYTRRAALWIYTFNPSLVFHVILKGKTVLKKISS